MARPPPRFLTGRPYQLRNPGDYWYSILPIGGRLRDISHNLPGQDGNAQNIVTAAPLSSFDAQLGHCIDWEADATNRAAKFPLTNGSIQPPQDFSFEVLTRITSLPSLGNFITIIGFGDDVASATYERQLYIDTNGNLVFYVYDGAAKKIVSSTQYVVGQLLHIVATSDQSNIKLYVNGVADGTLAAAGAYNAYPNVAVLQLGAMYAETGATITRNGSGKLFYANMLRRVLSESEAADRNRDRLGFLAPIGPVLRANTAVANPTGAKLGRGPQRGPPGVRFPATRNTDAPAQNSVALAGRGQGISAGRGALAAAAALASRGQGISTGRGTLDVSRPLVGRGQGISQGRGTLTVSQPLATRGQGISHARGALAANAALASRGQGISHARGALAAAGALTGRGQGISTGRGTLNAVDNTVITGAKIGRGPPRGPPGILFPATRNYARSIAQVGGRGQGISAARGTLAANAALTARGQSISQGRGTLGATSALAARGQGISAARGALAAAAALAARGQGISHGRGMLSVSRPLSGRGQGISHGRGTLTATAAGDLTGRGQAISWGRAVLTLEGGAAPITGGWIDPRTARGLLRRAQAYQREVDRLAAKPREERAAAQAAMLATIERSYAEITGEPLPAAEVVAARIAEPTPEAKTPARVVQNAIAVYAAVVKLDDTQAMDDAIAALDKAIMRLRIAAEEDDEIVLLLAAL